MSSTITFILVLSILILVHELGHLLAAKLFGIRADEFAIGMGPKLVTWFNDGETRYTIRLLPIGGFVNLYGEDLPDSQPQTDLSRTFFSKSVWARSVVLSAGVLMNYLLAVLLIMVVLFTAGEPKAELAFQIQSVNQNSPAAEAQLEPDNLIVGYRQSGNGEFQPVTDSETFVSFVNQHTGQPIELLIRPNNLNTTTPTTTQKLTLTPRTNYPEGEGPLGISFTTGSWINYHPIAWWAVPAKSLAISLELLQQILSGLGRIASDLLFNQVIPQDIAGPIGIAKITGQVAERGLIQLMQFTALISINLAVINILPLPALDGGRLAFVLYEAVTGRKLLPKHEGWIHTTGLVVFLLLLALISYYDIIRFF